MIPEEEAIDYLSKKGFIVKRQLHPDLKKALDIAISSTKKEYEKRMKIIEKQRDEISEYVRKLKNCKEQNMRLIKEHKKVMDEKVEELKKLIKETIKLRQEFEDDCHNIRDIARADSYQKQREDLEWCLEQVCKIFNKKGDD